MRRSRRAACNAPRSTACSTSTSPSRDYMLGDRLTMTDIPVGAMVNRWYGLDVPHPDLPNLRAWYERMVERPAYKEHIMVPIT